MNRYHIKCVVDGKETFLKVRGENKTVARANAKRLYNAKKIVFVERQTVDYIRKSGFSIVANGDPRTTSRNYALIS